MKFISGCFQEFHFLAMKWMSRMLTWYFFSFLFHFSVRSLTSFVLSSNRIHCSSELLRTMCNISEVSYTLWSMHVPHTNRLTILLLFSLIAFPCTAISIFVGWHFIYRTKSQFYSAGQYDGKVRSSTSCLWHIIIWPLCKTIDMERNWRTYLYSSWSVAQNGYFQA